MHGLVYYVDPFLGAVPLVCLEVERPFVRVEHERVFRGLLCAQVACNHYVTAVHLALEVGNAWLLGENEPPCLVKVPFVALLYRLALYKVFLKLLLLRSQDILRVDNVPFIFELHSRHYLLEAGGWGQIRNRLHHFLLYNRW